jgi:phospholipid/cholesterol/gamma-HCH transport system substrate-binding protein
MTKSRILRFGVLLVVAVALVGSAASMTLSASKPDQQTVVAMMRDAGSLEAGSTVRASGVEVGSVRSIGLQNGEARVEMSVASNVLPLHRDASVRLRPVNLLGEHYVDLSVGSPSQPFMNDPVIPVSRTGSAPELQDLINTFDDPTATGLAALVTSAGEGMQGNGDQTAAAIRALAPSMNRLGRLGSLLGDQNGALNQLLERVQPVSNALADDRGRSLNRLVGSTDKTLSTLRDNRQALDQTVAQLPATLVSARQTLARLGGVTDSATPALASIRPVTGNLSQITGELQRFADAADPAIASLPPVLQRADELLGQAAPVVNQLRQAGGSLAGTAKGVRPIGETVLDEHLGDLMNFVRKWALSTNGRDALGNYFRGVVHVTPKTLMDLAQSLPPKLGGQPAPPAGTSARPGPPGPDSLTGLSPTQEHGLLGQLLGGS